jgi:hypothetical protein
MAVAALGTEAAIDATGIGRRPLEVAARGWNPVRLLEIASHYPGGDPRARPRRQEMPEADEVGQRVDGDDASRGFRAVRTIAAATVLGSDTPGGGLTARRT